jgi:F-type H+-transporting ATPase subunit epsilon
VGAKCWQDVEDDAARARARPVELMLATSAEKADEIDVARAEESRKRALDRLSHPLADMDTARALAALKRAQARVETAAKK